MIIGHVGVSRQYPANSWCRASGLRNDRGDDDFLLPRGVAPGIKIAWDHDRRLKVGQRGRHWEALD